MKSQNFYKVVIVILILLNLSTLAFFWFNRPPHPPHMPPPPPGIENISEHLGLEGEKKKKVDALEIKHHETMKGLVEKDLQLHEDLFNSIGGESSGEELLGEIRENKDKIEHTVYAFFNEVSKHCDKSQKEELNEFVKRRLHRMRPAPPPPPPAR